MWIVAFHICNRLPVVPALRLVVWYYIVVVERGLYLSTLKRYTFKMADRLNVLSDVLCFTVNKFVNNDVKTVKAALFDFYTVDDLHEAKMRLVDDIDKLDVNTTGKRPHIPHRRDGDDRLRREVDDLMSLISFVDEQKLFSQLPRYVSESPDKMPSLRLYQGDMDVIMRLLHNMEHKVEELRSALAAITCDVHAMQARPPEPTQASSVTNSMSGAGIVSDVDNRLCWL